MQRQRIPVEIVACDPRHYVRCQKMIESISVLPPKVQNLIEYRLWTLEDPDGYEYARALGCHSPALVINGRVAFQDVVPTIDQLFSQLVQEARTEADRLTIHSAWADVTIAYEEEQQHHHVAA